MTDRLDNRRHALATLLGLGAALTVPLSARAQATVGSAAPEFNLNGPGGSSLNNAALAGKVIYLDFWASWCGPCRQSFPWMNDLQTRLGPKGLQVVGISVDKQVADAERFLSEVPARFAVLFDPKGESPRRYGVKGMPTSVIIGGDGVVQQVHAGFRPEDRAPLEAALTAALARLPAAKRG